jgi:hypothetical protein
MFLQVTGNSSTISATASYYYTPTLSITPKTATSGATITVNGKHFSSSGGYGSPLYIFWLDPKQQHGSQFTQLGTVTTNPDGSFSTPVTAPAGLVSGQTYYVMVNDSVTNLWAKATFVAQ